MSTKEKLRVCITKVAFKDDRITIKDPKTRGLIATIHPKGSAGRDYANLIASGPTQKEDH